MMRQTKLGRANRMKESCKAKKFDRIKRRIFPVVAAVTLCAGMTLVAAQPMLVAWQTDQGFAKDTTVDAVQFAKTNGFDYVKLEVDHNTDLRPLLSCLGDRLGVWIEFHSYSGAFGKRLFDELKSSGIDASRVVLSPKRHWVYKDIKRIFPKFRYAWSDQVFYDYASCRWRVSVWGQSIYCDNVAELSAAVCSFAKTNGFWGVSLKSQRFGAYPEVIEGLHTAGIKVIISGVNDPVTGDYYRKAKADALITALPAYTCGGSWPTADPKAVKYIGHRGGEDYLAPEHSLAMAQIAARKNLDIVKLDVHATRDGEIVTQHDPTLKRVFGVDKRIKDCDYSELSKYEAIPVNCISNQHLATLRQILQVTKGGVGEFWIDFKAFTPQCAEKTLTIIDDEKIAHSRVMVATYSRKALEYMRDNHPEIRRVMHISPWIKAGRWRITHHTNDFDSVEGVIGEIAHRQRELGLFGVNLPGGISPFGTFRTEHETIDKLKKLGLWIAIYFPCDPVSADYYRRAGVDAFVTGSVRSCEKLGK